jgi:hypothetical protein
MLGEIEEVRQIEGEGFRRWFADADFDLIVWYTDESRQHLDGFQLCYDKKSRERCVTWRNSGSYQHHRVDDGENPFQAKMTPVLVADGVFERDRVLEGFLDAATRVDREIVEVVRRALEAYATP